MIKNDFISLISNDVISQKPNNQIKKSEARTGDSFQQILNVKREMTTNSNYSKKNFVKEGPVRNQDNNKNIMQNMKNVKQETEKYNRCSEGNYTNSEKPEKYVADDKKENNLDIIEEKKCEDESNNIYSLFAAVVNPIELSSTIDLGDLTSKISKDEEVNVLSLNSVDSFSMSNDINIITSYENSMKQMINLELVEEIDENLVYELNNTSILDDSLGIDYSNENKQEVLTFMGDNIGEKVNESQGFTVNSFTHNVSEYKTEVEEEKGIDSLTDTNFELKDTLSQKTSTDEPSEKEEAGLIEEIRLQEKTEFREQTAFSQLDHNNLNFNGKDIEVIGTSSNEKTIISKENVFDQIVEAVKVEKNNTDEIRIKLKPDFLGEIFIKLSTEKGVITAKAYVENSGIKQLIESNLDILKDNIRELGLNLEGLDVSVGKDSSFERNSSQSWKQEQRIKVKKMTVGDIPANINYDERMIEIAGGLYSEKGSIDLIV